MQNQELIISNIKSFDIKHIFDCGQCFRRNEQQDWSYVGIFWNNILNVNQYNDCITFRWYMDWNINILVKDYFDLDRDYDSIKERLSKVDLYMKQSIEYWWGIRLLNQNLWETIISFMISANNNIPRIKTIIERLCTNYGNEINREWNIYYTFPTPEALKDVSVSDFRNLWLWFRDQRIFDMVRLVLDGKFCLSKLYKEETETIRENLLQINWIWPKVADCILLFSDLKRMEVFPIDVRVRRVMNDLYIHNPDETKVDKNQILSIAHENFWDLAWIAQEYLFYRARTQNKS